MSIMEDLVSALDRHSRELRKLQRFTPTPSRLPLFVQTATVTVANTVTQTTLLGAGVGSATLPANRLVAGSTIMMEAWGYHSTDASPPTLRIRMKIGTNSVGNIITHIGATTTDLWHMRGIITCRTVGATGTVFAQAFTLLEESQEFWEQVTTAVLTVDTTGTLALDVTAEWSIAEATATISCTNALIELIN